MKKGLIAGVLSLMIAGTACVQAFAAETVGKNGQIYQPGDTVMIDENATEAKFEAVWGVKVVFKDYDGTILSEQVVEVGKNAKRPQSPTREGYTFVGLERRLYQYSGRNHNPSGLSEKCTRSYRPGRILAKRGL